MADPDDIRAWQRLSKRITTSGRLREGDPARLAAIGVRHVINLALAEHPEALPDAETAFAAQGIAYTHIPVPFDAPREEHYRTFVEALETTEEPVHVHCIANWRVSAFSPMPAIASSSSSLRRAISETRAPRHASNCAVTSPIPLDPPVTTICRPWKSISVFSPR